MSKTKVSTRFGVLIGSVNSAKGGSMRRIAIALAALALGLTVAGIAISSTGTTLKLTARPTNKYDKKTLTAKAGRVTIVMKNLDVTYHNIAIKGHGVNARGKMAGFHATSTVTAVLKSGTYEFYCSVQGHEAEGMKGTLIVK